MFRGALAAILVLIGSGNLHAQVQPPKRESRWHHVFSGHRETNNLERRFEALKCAMAVVDSGLEQGTGFFISADGDMVTAFHVLGVPEFTPQGAQMNIT